MNRVHPDFGGGPPGPLRARAAELADRTDPPAVQLRARYKNLAAYTELGDRERRSLGAVADRIGAATVAYVPSLPHDVVDFAALDAVARLLTHPAAGTAPTAAPPRPAG